MPGTSIEHSFVIAGEKLYRLIRSWPLTLFGTAVVFGLAIGIGIGIYISCQAMAWRGL